MAGKKRGNREGSVYQRKDGVWAASISTPTGRKVAYAKTRREAAEKLQALQQAAAGGLPTARRDLTVESLMAEYLAAKKAVWRPKTYQYALHASTAYIVPHLGSVRLSDLDARRVAAWLRALPTAEGRSLSPRSVQLARAYLSRACDLAVRWDWMPRNPVLLTDAPRSAPKKHIEASPSVSRAIRAAFAETRWECLVCLLLGCGLRIGEALGLQWGDWQEASNRLMVRRQLQRANGTSTGKFERVELKTRASRRDLPLPAFVAESLRKQRDSLPSPPKDSDLIVATHDGQSLAHSNVNREFKAGLARAGLPPPTLHQLRHLCASHLIAEGIPLTAVAAYLGHASPAVTMAIYAHLVKGGDDAAAAALDGVFGSHGVDS